MKANCKICGRETYVLPWEETLCYYCKERQYDEKIKEDIQNGEATETSCEDKVYCPWCGEEYETTDEPETAYVDGDHEVECGECGKPFKISTHVSVCYDTERIERREG